MGASAPTTGVIHTLWINPRGPGLDQAFCFVPTLCYTHRMNMLMKSSTPATRHRRTGCGCCKDFPHHSRKAERRTHKRRERNEWRKALDNPDTI